MKRIKLKASEQPSQFDLDLLQRLVNLSNVLVEIIQRIEVLEGNAK